MALDGFNFFTDCYFQFLSVMEKTSIVLPRGQLTHVLRHTFAAHFMMSGGNILALQKILGHHDIKMTMRYAHLAPDHLETALRLIRWQRYQVATKWRQRLALPRNNHH